MYYDLKFIIPENSLTKALNINGCKLVGFKTQGDFVDIWIENQIVNKSFSYYGEKKHLLPEMLQNVETKNLIVNNFKMLLETTS